MDYRQLALQMLENWHTHTKVAFRSFCKVGSTSFILMCIEQNPNISPMCLSEMFGVSKSRVAKVIGELMQEDLIVVKTKEEDKRCTYVNITDKGNDVLSAQKEEYINGMSRLLEALGEKDAKEYVRIQQKISELKNK